MQAWDRRRRPRRRDNGDCTPTLVLGSEPEGREPEKLLVQPGQGSRALEQEIGGELSLIDDPANPVAREMFAQERIDPLGIAVENPGPIEAGKAIGLALRLGRVVEFSEG